MGRESERVEAGENQAAQAAVPAAVVAAPAGEGIRFELVQVEPSAWLRAPG